MKKPKAWVTIKVRAKEWPHPKYGIIGVTEYDVFNFESSVEAVEVFYKLCKEAEKYAPSKWAKYKKEKGEVE